MGKIVLATGFLGSGKTTFIKQLIDDLSSKDTKIALIVNEIGEIGIDNLFMKQLGYNIWELFGGCICCTLSSGLESTLIQLESEYDPELIIIEPSGAADPYNTINALLNHGYPREDIINFFILDMARFDMFVEIMSPLFIGSLKQADVVLINKIKYADEKSLKEADEIISKENEDSTVINIYKNDYLVTEVQYLINHVLGRE
ncbi:MAG: GTP-binding protein [Eubacteriaceae bacterium]|nr:GTP-binding protein [Eubacteriaceae bacterium]